MGVVRIHSFKGQAPRVDARSLGPEQSQNATNCKLQSNALTAWRDNLKVADLVQTGTLKTLYRFGPEGGLQYWLSWAEDVNVARGAVAGDSLERTYFTGTDYPRFTTNVLAAATWQNLLRYSEDFSDAAWTSTATVTSNAVVAPDGATTGDTLNDTSGTAAQTSQQAYADSNSADVTNKAFSVYLQPGTAAESAVEIAFTGGATPKVKTAVIAWSAKTITNGTIRKVGAGPWYLVQVSDTNNATGNTAVVCRVYPAGTTVANTGTVWAWGAQLSETLFSSFYSKTTTTIIDNPNTYPRLAYRLGLPVPVTVPALTVTGAAGGSPKARAYVYTFVSALGEEGPPSAASAIVNVETGQSVEIRSMDDQPFGDYDVTAIRLYRIASGTAGSAYQFVAEIAMPAPSVGLQYTDSITDANLGAVLQTATHVQPPADMKGILALPNGVMVGFSGNQICFSEPYLPYAWPTAYRLTSESTIVGIAAYGTTVVVGTSNIPYLISATDPATASMSKATPHPAPCIAKRAMVTTELGVVYPTNNGLQAFGPGVARLISSPFFTKYEWVNYNPSTMHAVFHDGRYYSFYETGVVLGLMTGGAIVLDLMTPGAEFTTLNIYRTAGYAQPYTTKLYLINNAFGNQNTVEEWEGAGTKLYYTWKSKIFHDVPTRITAAQAIGSYDNTLTAEEVNAINAQRATVIAYNNTIIASDNGGLGAAGLGAIGLSGDNLSLVPSLVPLPEGVVMRIYGDRTLISEKTINSSAPVRIPSTDKHREWEIELIGRRPITDVAIASTIAELKRIP